MSAETTKQADCEYIVVGSGAGGGPVAANLAEAGHKVLLLEAGGDPLQLPDSRLPEDYHVPAFHAFASENDGAQVGLLCASLRQRSAAKSGSEVQSDA